jgi:hypothetical protein
MDFLDNTFEEMGITTEEVSETNKKLQSECKEVGMQVTESIDNSENHKQNKIFYGLSTDDREQAVKEFIIPKAYMNASFSSERIRDNLRELYPRDSRRTRGFDEYEATCNGILSSIRMKNLPDKSYIIGAPNGFGKNSFVTECLITLRKHGFNTVPYISLNELADISNENDIRIQRSEPDFIRRSSDTNDKNIVYLLDVLKKLNYLETLTELKNNGTLDKLAENKVCSPAQLATVKKVLTDTGERDTYGKPKIKNAYMYLKTPEVITGRYSYSEYINADCLFVFTTGILKKDIESKILYQLLTIRGAKGLPTIVMISTSIEVYTNDRKLKEQIWDEIIAYSEKKDCYDRVFHVSCYRDKVGTTKLDDKGKSVEPDTGIVH